MTWRPPATASGGSPSWPCSGRRAAPALAPARGPARWSGRRLLISTAQLRRFSLAFAAIQAVPGFALFMLVMFVPSSPLTRAYAREVFEFIRPLPFSRGQRFVGGVLILLLSTLTVPLVMTAAIDLDWINSGGLMAWFVKGDTHASTLRYLREALGATFLPETWPPGGLTLEMWARLRPLLWLDLLRIAAFVVAALFGGAVLAGPRSLWLSALVSMVVKVGAVICAIRLSLGDIFGVPVPPLWFALLLAAVAVGNWTWCARVVNLPDAAAGPPATGSSTAG